MIKNILEYKQILCAKTKEIIKNFISMKKYLLILILIYILGMSAILRANFNYIDDMGRVFEGYKGWEDFSRYTSNFLSNFIHADSYLTDVSPLPQLLACVLLAVSGIIVLHVISEKKRFTIWELIAVIPLGLSPYFLECLSYKFDSPYMAVSILASVLPIIFYKKGYAYFIASILGSIIVCTTYQAATGIFPMLVILLALKMWNNRNKIKEIIKFIITSTIGYGIGLIIFKLFIMKSTVSYSSKSILSLNQIIPGTFNHLKQYFSYVISDFKTEWIILILLLCIGFIYAVVRDSKQKKTVALIASLGTIIIMLLVSFGIYPLLESPLYAPRAMYGFGAFIAIVGVFVTTAQKMYFSKIVSVLLSWMFFVFAFTYGNALYVQSVYTDFRITTVIDDLKDLETLKNEEIKTVQISGTVGLAPSIQNMPQDYQILNRLIPITFGDSTWMWASFGFSNYYGLKNISWNSSIDLTTYDLPIVKETIYHTIKANNEYILIELK